MAIAVVYRPPAMTAAQYLASWEGRDAPPLPTPHGLLFHAGIGEGADFFTVSVWQSREDYDAFAPSFTQAMAERGFTFGTPAILPVHHSIPPSAPSIT
jgi:hypothetical protein